MSEKHYTTSQQLGLDFYNSKEQFEKFKVDIKKVFNKAKITFPKILDNTLTQKILKNFFKVAKSIFDYYSWMDPLFTDEAFKRSSTSPILKKHLDEVSVIKDEYREQLNSFFLEDDNFLEKLIHKLSRDFDVAVEDLKFYRIHELYGLFEDKKVLSQELRERKNAYLLIGLSKNIESLYGENAQSVIASIVKHREYQGGNIQGTVANVSSTPKIEGRVKKIPLDYSDFVTMKAVMSEMKQGEILVAQSTAPELLPACKKAAAIITNVGGLLSHAAIVSREFNIPCIVGTVHATEVLKDGDLVEVDADNGTVKILETYE
ncbi:hypothetical protein KC866_00390 [Patescibacteria group bacterium]|nr:hypothetical protein [Patescibacteria group bacterium]